MRFRMAIIGAGNIAQSAHIPAYRNIENIDVVAIADWNLDRAREAAKAFPGCHAYRTVEEVLASEEIHGIDVCVWNESHAAVTIAAAKAGKHVLCEKPMSVSVEEGTAMKKAVEDAGVTFMLAVPRRYYPDSLLLGEMVEEGDLGDIYYGKCAMVRRRGTPIGWFTDSKKSGGGPVFDIGVHCIDLTWYLMGRPKPVRISAQTSYAIGNFKTKGVERWTALDHDECIFDTEDSAAGVIHFDNNACMLFETSWAMNCREQQYTQICGTKGGAELEPLRIYTEENGYIIDKTPKTSGMNRFEYEIRHFVDCVLTGKKPTSSLEDALTVQKILCGIYESAKTRREIVL